jgi:hypothetical protein
MHLVSRPRASSACLVLALMSAIGCGSEAPAPEPAVTAPVATPEVAPVAEPMPAASPTEAPAAAATPGIAHRLAVAPGGGCAIASDASLHCWGDVLRGESAPERPSPRPRAVARATAESVAMSDAGVCWIGVGRTSVGCAAEGFLAALDPETDDRSIDDANPSDDEREELDDRDDEQRLGGIAPYADLDIGSAMACVVSAGGSVICVGDDEDSPLRLVPGIDDAVAVAVAGTAACAMRRDGSVSCWGDLIAGDGVDDGDGGRRVRAIAGLANIVQIDAGEYFFCARDASGVVACWGTNTSGELGSRGEVADPNAPQAVPGITGASDVFAGPFGACATLADGVRCWGVDDHGQLAGGAAMATLPPTAMPALSGASAIAISERHLCARLPTGIRCWGLGAEGALGPHGVPARYEITRVMERGALRLLTSTGASCADTGGGMRCWGNWFSEGEDGAPAWTQPRRTDRLTDPDHLLQFGDDCLRWDNGGVHCPSLDLIGTRALAITRGGSCAVLEDGSVSCQGHGRMMPPTPTGVTDARAIDLSESSACAVTAAGSVWCWSAGTPAASEVTALAGSDEVVVLLDRQCGRLAGGTVRCVGSDVVELGLTEVRHIEGAGGHACALVATTAGGEVHCWGKNDAGVLGGAPDPEAPFATTPRRIEGLAGTAAPGAAPSLEPGIVEISVASDHACARRADGAVYCWGADLGGSTGTIPGLHLTGVDLPSIP